MFLFSTKQNLASGPIFFSFHFPAIPEKITVLLPKKITCFSFTFTWKKCWRQALGAWIGTSAQPLQLAFKTLLFGTSLGGWGAPICWTFRLSDRTKASASLFFLRMKWNTHQPGRLVHWKIPVLSRLTNKLSSYVNRVGDAIYLFICLKGEKKRQLVCRLLAKCMSSGGGKEKSTTKEFTDKILRTPNWVKIAFWQISPIANETEIQVIL